MTEAIKLERAKIVGSIATLFSGSAIAQAMTALALLLTARQLSAPVYGQYAASIALASITSILFSLGLDIWLLREGGRSPERIPVLTGSVLGIKTLFGLSWIAIFLLFAPALNQSTYPLDLVRWSVLLIWLDTLLATGWTGFKSALVNKVPAILESSADIVWLGLTVLLVVMGVYQPVFYLQIRVLISFLALIVTLLLSMRMMGLRLNKAVMVEALKSMFPFATSEFLGMVTLRADVVIIGLMLGEYATGVYSPAVGLINMAMLVPMAVYTVMVPVLGNLYNSHPDQAIKISVRSIVLQAGLGLILMLIFFSGSPLIVSILGESYRPSVEITRILSLVLLFKCVSFGLAAIIIATDKQARRTIIQAAAALVNITLNLAVVKTLGVEGVAGVYVLTEVILMTGYALVVWKKR